MTPEIIFQELLGLGQNWVVEQCIHEGSPGKIVIRVKETEHLWDTEKCPKCSGKVSCYDHTEPLRWRHLNCFEHECEIECRLPRGRCKECGHTYRVQPPWEGKSKHFTKEFEAFTLLLAREMPIKKVGDILKETDTRLWRMIIAHVEAAYRQADFSGVTCIGADELSRCRGHHFLTVFADLEKKRVLFATEGRDMSVWARFCEELLRHNAKAEDIRTISIDMSQAYVAGIYINCPNAKKVFDKFHIIAAVNKAVDDVRRTEMRKAGCEAREMLNKSRWLWLKNPTNLTEPETERMGRMDLQNLCTAKAYQMRLTLQDIYAITDPLLAKRKMLAWCRWVLNVARRRATTMYASMVRCVKMIQRHLDGVLAYWDCRVTNGFMEGLNSVFSAVKRKARGYRNPLYLKAILYFVAGKLQIPATH
ncbi:MAG: ISL3 family transposase [bacterium]